MTDDMSGIPKPDRRSYATVCRQEKGQRAAREREDALLAEARAEREWEENEARETVANRCPPRE